MAFVITYGPLDDEKSLMRETALEALGAILTLREEGARHLTVTYVETGDAAVEALRVLAEHEEGVRSGNRR